MFTKALGFIKSLLTGFSTVAPVLSVLGVAVPPVALIAAPVALTMMEKAEEALGDGTGPIKKKAVTEGMNAFVGVMAQESTGGQKKTYERLTPDVVSTLIDTLATVANNVAKSADRGPVFDMSDDPVLRNLQ